MYIEKYQITSVSLRLQIMTMHKKSVKKELLPFMTLTCFSLPFASCQVDKI